MAKVFISYKHDAHPDLRIANAALQRLTQAGHQVFIDNQIQIGDEWPAVIEDQLTTADYLIVFLSEAATSSEMVIEEVAIARRVRKRLGRPKILPVRVANEEPFPYDLGAWLDRIQCAFWRKDGDETVILDQLADAMTGAGFARDVEPSPSAHALAADGNAASAGSMSAPLPAFDPRWLEKLDSPGGAVRLKSPFYIERDLDNRGKRAISADGITLLIKGGRQTGKTSALARLLQHARDNGISAIFIDFQRVDAEHLSDLNTLLRYLADVISLKLKTNETPDRYWNSPLGPKDKLSTFLEQEVLSRLASPMALILDEVDRLFAYPAYRNDFFGLVRSWHNNRAFNEAWDRLNIVIAYATEASLLIADQTQSPFNVGETLEATDFERKHIVDLNQKHGGPLRTALEIDSLEDLAGGQPFLVRKALYEMACRRTEWSALLASAFNDDGPFGDHLQRYRIWLAQKPEVQIAFKSALREGRCDTDNDFHVLRSCGLIRGHTRHAVRARCALYEKYFKDRL